MKKVVLALAAAAVLAGCQKPEVEGPVESNDLFTASVEEFDAQTKTALAPGNYVVWSAGDRLAIFQGSAIADEYKLAEGSEGLNGGSFQWVAKDNVVNGDFNAGTELPCNVAFYPYSQGMLLAGDMEDGGKKTFTLTNLVLPEVQTYVANSFGNGSFPMVAVTANMADHNLKFKNVGGALKLQLKGSCVVKSIKVEGKSGEKLSGAATVTAYANNQAPAIKMASDASTFVMLDCVDGVQLNESATTAFYVALPPVLFQNGFKITVTDVDNQEYEVESKNANAIVRNGILVMPAVKLGADAEETPEGDGDATYIEYILLNQSSLTMMPNTQYQLVADIDPIDVTYPTLTWVSSDNTIATVDANGLVTVKSDGNATITVLAVGGESDICEITVKTPKQFAESEYIDYVDEHGKNYGKGVAVAGTIWAPVNCGYEPAEGDYRGYTAGKFYQWGRKYGQGYGGFWEDYPDSDASYPTGDNMIKGPVMPSLGSSESYKDAFFCDSYNWCKLIINDLWVDADGNKTQNDPCPTGWRVPTSDELSLLCRKYVRANGGYIFVGEYTYIDDIPQVYLPGNGYRDYMGGCYFRGTCCYWSSKNGGQDNAYGLSTLGDRSSMSTYNRADGNSVRCVQE